MFVIEMSASNFSISNFFVFLHRYCYTCINIKLCNIINHFLNVCSVKKLDVKKD